MPIYEYRCLAGHAFEELERGTEHVEYVEDHGDYCISSSEPPGVKEYYRRYPARRTCPECGAQAERVLSAANVRIH
jgi:predicted nucleic acid-binding Zn ribbon protein